MIRVDRAMMYFRRVAAFVLLAGLALASGHAAVGAKELLESAQTADDAVIAARPGGGAVLGLADCVKAALAQNDLLRAERLRRKELDGRMFQALATGLPTIDATGEWNRSRDPSFALDETFGGGGSLPAPLDSLLGGFSFLPAPEDIPAQTFWRAGLNLHWTVNPTKVLGAVGAANLGIRHQDLAVRQTEHEITEQTMAAYHEIIVAAERLGAVEAQIATQRELLEILRLRCELGVATALDTLQAAVALANSQPALRRARLGLQTSGAKLNSVMGRQPEAPLAIRREQVVELEPIDRERALVLARERPDVARAALLADILKRNRSAQRSDLLPYLSLDGSAGYVGRGTSDLFDNGHDFWRATATVTVPLFDGLLTRGLVKETSAAIRRTEAERDGLRRRAEVEVLELLDGLEAARENLAAADLNLQRSEDALAQSTLKFRLGTVDYLSVLDAEANRAQARSNLIEARHEVLTLTASCKRALGQSPLLPLAAIDGLVPGEMP